MCLFKAMATNEDNTPKHSAPGEKRVPCRMPQLWEEHPDLEDIRGILRDSMSRIHDWADLIDMVSFHLPIYAIVCSLKERKKQ